MDQPSHTEGREIDKSVVVRWAYVKELAATSRRERGKEIIRLYMRGKHGKGWGEENIYG